VAIHGWLIIDKPVGPGSTQVVSAVKRALRDGGYPKLKVGHGGTLDPLASGCCRWRSGKRPSFAGGCWMRTRLRVHGRFGVETSTLDAEGEVVATSDVRPTLEEVEAVLPSFTGAIEQVPPVYSALKVDGRRAYDLARAGEQVEMKSRRVTIHALSIRHSRESGDPASLFDGAVEEQRDSRFRGNDRVTLIARVSKGTYIRSLARDIAHALRTVGHVTMLRRIKAGPFTLDPAISLDKLAELGHARALEQALLPLTAGLDDIPALPVTPDQARALRQGRKLIGIAGTTQGLHLATEASVPVALVELEGAELRVVRGFNL
jgi:tRNA pseudouridine55 synthase